MYTAWLYIVHIYMDGYNALKQKFQSYSKAEELRDMPKCAQKPVTLAWKLMII